MQDEDAVCEDGLSTAAAAQGPFARSGASAARRRARRAPIWRQPAEPVGYALALRWEFFVVAGLWGLAAALFKAAGTKGSAKGVLVAGGIVLSLAGVALLGVRFGLQHGAR